MNTVLTSLILFSIFCLSTIAQDTSRWGLPEGAKARLDIGGGRIFDVKYSPDGSRLAVASSSGVWLYNLESGDAVPLMRSGNSFRALGVAFSADGRTLAAATDVIFGVWDAVTGKQKRSLHLPKFFAISSKHVAFSQDGDTLAVGIDDTVRLRDAVTGKSKHALSGQRFGVVASLAFSPDGRILASGHRSPSAGHSSGSTKIRVWDAETGELKTSLTEFLGLPTSFSFSPDGQTLASGNFYWHIGGDQWGSISLWDVATWELKLVLNPPYTGATKTGGVLSIAYSPDGRTLASGHLVYHYFGDEFGTVRIWDLETGENIRMLDGHTDAVTSVAFSPDGSTLASGSNDGTVLLWEIFPSPDLPEDKHPQVAEPSQVKPDVNEDGRVEVQDLVLVAARLGISAENRSDVNGDGTVNILDLVLVAGMADDSTDALPMFSNGAMMLRTTQVKKWLEEARRLDLADPAIPKGIEYLQNLLKALTPERTALLPNFPNPFNPETWIPYQLARDSAVQISIYSSKGILVRQLGLGLQPEGFYTDKHYAAYWDGRNDGGELLASGVYVYVFRAGSYRASRRMAFVR